MNRTQNNLSLLLNFKQNSDQTAEWAQAYNQPVVSVPLLSQVKEFLLESSASYPSIGEWWDARVTPGLKNGERFCQIVFIDSQIVALSIGKFARSSSKLCTLRVHDKYKGLGIGQFLLHKTLSTLAHSKCKNIHYTISENNQSQFGEFFSSYGFSLSAWRKSYYVKGIDELIFSATTDVLMKKHVVSPKIVLMKHNVRSLSAQDVKLRLPLLRTPRSCGIFNAEDSL